MRYHATIFTIFLMIFVSACSDDSSGPGDIDDLGVATLNVTGDINRSHSGQADFSSFHFLGLIPGTLI